jgi:cleavage stimulation factor subunit 2
MPPQPVRPPSQMQGGSQGPPQGPRSLASAAPNIGPAGASDQEKVAGRKVVLQDYSGFLQAALIMQVLQLSDEQIAMLPPEQRNSILVLKEQIAKSAHR